MRILAEIDYGGDRLVIEGSNWSGHEQVRLNDHVVSQTRNFATSGSHSFPIPGIGQVNLSFQIDLADRCVRYRLTKDEDTLTEGQQPLRPGAPEQPAVEPGTTEQATQRRAPGMGSHVIAFAGAFFKLFKSAGAVKVALAGSSFAGWSLLFNWQFSLMLLSIIVFHEYGHVRAMKRCGIPTKGFYLIPFFGGVAIGDKARTYWHEVYVSMMGPVFGLLMSAVAWVGYVATGNEILGLVASFGALVNLFNLLPIYPLDGGHVLKAVTLSASPRYSLYLLLALSAAGVALTFSTGLFLLTFFLVLGTIDLLATRKTMATATTVPMNGYAMTVSILWYAAVIALLVLIILQMAGSGLPGTEIARIVLED